MAKRFWTTEEVEYLIGAYPDVPLDQMTAHLATSPQRIYDKANKLGLRRSEEFARKMQQHLGKGLIKSGAKFRFTKGQEAYNKGLKQEEFMRPESIDATKATRFKKGNKPANTRPVGSERIDSKDGYILVKIKGRKRWEAKHRLVWEKAHGRIKPGEVIRFINGDKTDVRLENLYCTTQGDNMELNSIHRYPPAVKSAIFKLGKLSRLTRAQKGVQDEA